MIAGVMIGHLGNPGNEGTIIRSAELFGISLALVIGKKNQEYKSSQGADKHMIFKEFKNYKTMIKYIKENNHRIVCLENIDEAQEMEDIEHYPVNPIFITGHERMGVPKELLKEASLIVKIKQGLGYGTCLNTAAATAIILNDFHKKELKDRRKDR